MTEDIASQLPPSQNTFITVSHTVISRRENADPIKKATETGTLVKNGQPITITPSVVKFPELYAGTELDNLSRGGEFSLHMTPESLKWLEVEDKVALSLALNNGQKINVTLNKSKSQSLNPTTALAASWKTQGATNKDISFLIASDPVHTIPDIRKNTSLIGDLDNELMAQIISAIGFTTQYDTPMIDRESAIHEAQQFLCGYLVKLIEEGPVENKSRHQINAEGLIDLVRPVAEAIGRRVENDLRNMTRITIAQSGAVLGIVISTLSAALRILEGKMYTKSQMGNTWATKISGVALYAANMAAIALLIHSVSFVPGAILVIASGQVSDPGSSVLGDMFANLVIHVRDPEEADEEYKNAAANLQQRVNAKRDAGREGPVELLEAYTTRLVWGWDIAEYDENLKASDFTKRKGQTSDLFEAFPGNSRTYIRRILQEASPGNLKASDFTKRKDKASASSRNFLRFIRRIFHEVLVGKGT